MILEANNSIFTGGDDFGFSSNNESRENSNTFDYDYQQYRILLTGSQLENPVGIINFIDR